eukprot:Rhum_TRINITY_DN15016_c0_g3::Rhum_TRINITY_DN15016_c0_g3_i6::g.133465::m.133465
MLGLVAEKRVLGVFLMHVSFSGNEKAAQLCFVQTDSKLQRRLIVVVLGTHISSSVEEKSTHFCVDVSLTDGMVKRTDDIVKRCAPLFVLRIRVSPSVEKKCTHFCVGLLDSMVKRCAPCFVLHIQVSP